MYNQYALQRTLKHNYIRIFVLEHGSRTCTASGLAYNLVDIKPPGLRSAAHHFFLVHNPTFRNSKTWTRVVMFFPPPASLSVSNFPKIYRVRPMSCLPRKFPVEFVMGGQGAACLVFYHCIALFSLYRSRVMIHLCLCPAENLRSPGFKTKDVGRYPWASENTKRTESMTRFRWSCGIYKPTAWAHTPHRYLLLLHPSKQTFEFMMCAFSKKVSTNDKCLCFQETSNQDLCRFLVQNRDSLHTWVARNIPRHTSIHRVGKHCFLSSHT